MQNIKKVNGILKKKTFVKNKNALLIRLVNINKKW